jgi:N-methylhydantoinase A/oxoprolinase/acetone carboxylase beta subunit
VGRSVLEVVDKIEADASENTQFVHGTTVGLNNLLERKGPKVVLATILHKQKSRPFSKYL